jgi:hypothetical protein
VFLASSSYAVSALLTCWTEHQDRHWTAWWSCVVLLILLQQEDKSLSWVGRWCNAKIVTNSFTMISLPACLAKLIWISMKVLKCTTCLFLCIYFSFGIFNSGVGAWVYENLRLSNEQKSVTHLSLFIIFVIFVVVARGTRNQRTDICPCFHTLAEWTTLSETKANCTLKKN